MGGFNPPPPIIYLDTWISNIDFLYTGNQRINANMVNKSTPPPPQNTQVSLKTNHNLQKHPKQPDIHIKFIYIT